MPETTPALAAAATPPTPDAPAFKVVHETLRSWGSGPASVERTVQAYGYTTRGGWVTFYNEDHAVVLDLPERIVLSIEPAGDAEQAAA